MAATPASPPLVFVDANILLYSEDTSESVKQTIAGQWLGVLWRNRTGRVSVQSLNEFYVNATRKLKPPMPFADAQTEVRRYEPWHPWQVDAATIESAWAIQSRFGFHYWDCLVLAAAQHLGCRYVLSEDMGHEQKIGSLQIINPFKANIAILECA